MPKPQITVVAADGCEHGPFDLDQITVETSFGTVQLSTEFSVDPDGQNLRLETPLGGDA